MSLSHRTGLSLNMGAHDLSSAPRGRGVRVSPGVPATPRTLAEEDRYFELRSDAEREEEWARDAELEDLRQSDTEIVL